MNLTIVRWKFTLSLHFLSLPRLCTTLLHWNLGIHYKKHNPVLHFYIMNALIFFSHEFLLNHYYGIERLLIVK